MKAPAHVSIIASVAIVLLLAGCEEASEPDIEPVGKQIPLEVFLFPNELERLFEPRLLRYREARSSWNQEEIQEYWHSPEEIGVSWLSKRSDVEIEGLLQTIR